MVTPLAANFLKEDMMNRNDRLRFPRAIAVAFALTCSVASCTSGQSEGATNATSTTSATAGPGVSSAARASSASGGSSASGAVSGSAAQSSARGSAPSTRAAQVGRCTKSSIQAALPKGSIVVKFDCTIASPAMWAAVRVKSGSVFFLTSVAGPWKATQGKQLCGSKVRDIPKDLRTYCD